MNELVVGGGGYAPAKYAYSVCIREVKLGGTCGCRAEREGRE